jgi:hypothetical protein
MNGNQVRVERRLIGSRTRSHANHHASRRADQCRIASEDISLIMRSIPGE